MVLDDPMSPEGGEPKKEFSITRKGYDPAEVDEYLAEYDVAIRELEDHTTRLKQELKEAKEQIRRLERAEQESIDNAMNAVFAAKERILERARQKALEIENDALAAAGLPPVTVTTTPETPIGVVDQLIDVEPQAALEEPSLPERPAVDVAAQAGNGGDPAAVLSQMLAEADAIRSQLENGLSAAFSEMQRMQQDAEVRATELLEEARQEAEQLRKAGESGGKTHPKSHETTLQVTLPQDAAADGDRRSRYTKNSARLPRIGTEDGMSVLASMNQLRTRLKEAEEVALQLQDPPAS